MAFMIKYQPVFLKVLHKASVHFNHQQCSDIQCNTYKHADLYRNVYMVCFRQAERINNRHSRHSSLKTSVWKIRELCVGT